MALDWFEQDNFERTAKEPWLTALKDRGADFYKAGHGCANHLAGGDNASRGPTSSADIHDHEGNNRGDGREQKLS